MTEPLAPAVLPHSDLRPVLFWRPDSDESHVQPGVAKAAQFLGVPADAVVAAIHRGDLLGGWFVDWEATGQAPG